MVRSFQPLAFLSVLIPAPRGMSPAARLPSHQPLRPFGLRLIFRKRRKGVFTDAALGPMPAWPCTASRVGAEAPSRPLQAAVTRAASRPRPRALCPLPLHAGAHWGAPWPAECPQRSCPLAGAVFPSKVTFSLSCACTW